LSQTVKIKSSNGARGSGNSLYDFDERVWDEAELFGDLPGRHSFRSCFDK
jgi:hypothetical protein